jgi:4,5-DOPA dioxygenase extradiol
MLSLFISHGAPTYALQPGIAGAQLRQFGSTLLEGSTRQRKPSAVLIVSPHWMTQGLRVATTAQPTIIYDFGGFDPALNQLRYPAPGEPHLALQAIAALQSQGWSAVADSQRGLDHGA